MKVLEIASTIANEPLQNISTVPMSTLATPHTYYTYQMYILYTANVIIGHNMVGDVMRWTYTPTLMPSLQNVLHIHTPIRHIHSTVTFTVTHTLYAAYYTRYNKSCTQTHTRMCAHTRIHTNAQTYT